MTFVWTRTGPGRRGRLGASEHDTNHFEDVSDEANTSRAVLADKGYVDGERETRLADTGWRMFIQRKGCKDKPLSDTPVARQK